MNAYALLAESVARSPEHPAVVWRGEPVRYGELLSEVDRLAGALAELGIRRGDRVAIHSYNRPEVLVAYFAVAKLGAIFVPINPELAPAEVAYPLAHAQPRLLLIDARLAANLRSALAQAQAGNARDVAPVLLEFDSPPYREMLRAAPPSGAPETVADDDGLLICYTSGSTGRPKGVFASHGNEIASARAYADVWHIGPGDRVSLGLPLAYLYGLTTAAVTGLGAGATLLLQERFHPGETLAQWEAAGATVFHGVPTMYAMIANFEPDRHFRVDTLRLALCAGAPLHEELHERFRRRFSLEIMDFYALSEIRPVFAYDSELYRNRRPGSCGHALPGVEVRIVAEDGNPVPPGEVGELLCRSATLMKGYYRDPELTGVAVRDGWFHTGDLARQDADGFYYIVGRKKDLIIRGGVNIAPVEIEAVLLRHPSVREAAVIGVSDPIFGEQVAAFLTLLPGKSISLEEVRSFCREHMADFKVPAHVRVLSEMPRGVTGKINRSALLALLQERVPQRD